MKESASASTETTRISFLLVAAVSSSSLFCAPVPEPKAPVPEEAPGTAFSRFVDRYFQAKFEFEPSNVTGVGLHQYDTKLEDRSRERIQARIGGLPIPLVRKILFR